MVVVKMSEEEEEEEEEELSEEDVKRIKARLKQLGYLNEDD